MNGYVERPARGRPDETTQATEEMAPALDHLWVEMPAGAVSDDPFGLRDLWPTEQGVGPYRPFTKHEEEVAAAFAKAAAAL